MLCPDFAPYIDRDAPQFKAGSCVEDVSTTSPHTLEMQQRGCQTASHCSAAMPAVRRPHQLLLTRLLTAQMQHLKTIAKFLEGGIRKE